MPEVDCMVYKLSMSRNRSNSRSSNSSQGGRRDDPGSEPSKRLFVGGISPDVDDADVRDLFEKVGTVCDFFVKKNEDRNSFGFVEFTSFDDAAKAISSCSGKRLGDNMIFVKYAHPKPKREGAERGGFKGDREEKPRFDRGQGNNKWNKEEGESRGGGFGRQGGFEGNRKFGGQRDSGNEGSRRFGGGQRESFEKRESKPVSNDFDY